MKKPRKHLPRRTPTQARSQARVQKILEAAADVVEEVGYDAATTNEIAARAGTSIGSLYQFFPNKAALMHALALGYMEELKGLFGKALAMGTEGLTWQDIVGRIVDTFAEFHRTRAGFKAVWFGGHLSPDLLAVAFRCGSDIAESAGPLVEMIAPDVPPERRALVARVATEIVGALLVVSSIETRPGFSLAFVAEAKIACTAYLERALGLPS
jgi:AcrR family transcriptional regulator